MKTNFLLTVLVAFSTLTTVSLFGQDKCGATEVRKHLIEQHPEILQFEKEMDDKISARKLAIHNSSSNARTVDTTTELVIPIVFHILHDDLGNGNLPDSRIFTEVDKIKNYYHATNADLAAVIPQHKPLIGNMHMTYRLANIDPQGNPTNGIMRYNVAYTNNGGDNAKIDPWPREKYMNVWVIFNMEQKSKSAAAFAHLPADVKVIYNNRITDGVIILQDYVGIGKNGSSGGSDWSTLSHELGHCMNLSHNWGRTNAPGVACGDDDVEDTPVTKGWDHCPTLAAAATEARVTCGFVADNHGLFNDTLLSVANYQNIMEYSFCSRMFTQKQVERVRSALLVDSLADRQNLITTANLTATGTLSEIPNPSAPKADFAPTKRYACIGDAVTFTDYSYNGTIDSRNWTFPADADLQNSSVVSPVVHFSTGGWKTVSLEASNATGSNTVNKTMVYVGDNSTVTTAPYLESFENPTHAANWAFVDYDNDNVKFAPFGGTGYLSSNCLKLNSYKTPYDYSVDQVISPSYDLSALPNNAALEFYYSFAKFDETALKDSIDELVVSASKDCGLTWIKLNDLSNKSIDYIYPNLHNAGFLAAPFQPGMGSDSWKHVTAPLKFLGTGAAVQNVRFKFEVTSATTSNNFYLDNINVGGAISGIEDIQLVETFQVQPNPTNGDAKIKIEMVGEKEATVKVYDIVGKEIGTIFAGKLNAGTNEFSTATILNAAGIYIVRLQVGNHTQQTKFIKL